MRRTLTITDLTQMGNGVCIAGIDGQGNCVRPVVRGGVRKQHLFRGRNIVIYPRAVVEFDLSGTNVTPPHIEDMTFDPRSLVSGEDCGDAAWKTVLEESSFPSIDTMFDGVLVGGRRVPPGSATRSLGTIADAEIEEIYVDSYNDSKFRLNLIDPSGDRYIKLPINDLAFIAYFLSLIEASGSEAEAESLVNNKLASVNKTYIRIGLARPATLGNYERACWTQVTGIYTFPDYLGGKNFADFN